MKKSTLTLLTFCCAATSLCALTPWSAAEDTPPAAAAVQPAAPVPVSVDSNYRLMEEDIFRLDIWGEQALSNPQLQVTPDGKVNLAYIGEVQAAGLTQAELAQSIAKKLQEAQILEGAKVQITIISLHKPTARVLGSVQRPGEITFKDGDTILDAIAQAGSYRDDAYLEKATLTHRGPGKQIALDLRKMLNGDLTQNYELQRGDIVYVPAEDYQNKIYVLGLVMKPGIYPLKEKTTVMSAIGLAGGKQERGALSATLVVRGHPSKTQRVKCNLTKLFDKGDLSQDIALQPGDVVIVPETKKPDWSKISQLISTVINIGYLRRYGLF